MTNASEIEKLIAEYRNEINIEKLSGNVVKEELARGIVMGLEMAKHYVSPSRKARFNREKLAKKLFEEFSDTELGGDFGNNINHPKVMKFWLSKSDAIIASEKEILEWE